MCSLFAPSPIRRGIARRVVNLVKHPLLLLVTLAATARTSLADPLPGAKTDFDRGARPNSVAIGNLNGYGKTGLATANLGSNPASELLDNGGYTPGAVCIEPGDQVSPQMVSDWNRGAIVAWVDGRMGGSGIYAQHVQALLTLDPAWPVGGRALCTAPGARSSLRMVTDGAGGAIVTWEDDRSGDFDIYAQRVLATGVVDPQWPADGLALCTLTGDQRYPTIDSDGMSGAIIAWQDERNGLEHPDVTVQHVLNSGVVDSAWSPEGVSLPNAGMQRVIADGQHGAIVVHLDFRPVSYGTLAQHVTAAGAVDSAWPVGGFRVGDGVEFDAASDAAGGVHVFSTSEWILWRHLLASGTMAADSLTLQAGGHRAPVSPVVAADGAGGAVCAYAALSPLIWPDYFDEISAGLWRPTGGVGGWWRNADPGSKSEPAVAPDAAGGALVVWTDSLGAHPEIYLQHVMNSGGADPMCPVGGRSLSAWTNSAARSPRIVGDGYGGGIVAWQGRGDGDGSWNIYAAHISGDAPTEVVAALVSADATAGRARLEWYCGGVVGLSATIYRRTDSSAWQPIGTASSDGAEHLIFIDPAVRGGARYGYRLCIVGNDREAFYGETWLAIPLRIELALQGLQPNPAGSSASVVLSLPDDRPAVLAVLDVSGRRVLENQLGALGPGKHVVRLDGSTRLSAGLYFIQLTHGGRTLTTRGVIVR
jgi:hypothetical protein